MQEESVDLPPELKIMDESDIGFVSDDSAEIEHDISAFFNLRIQNLISELHQVNADAKFYQ